MDKVKLESLDNALVEASVLKIDQQQGVYTGKKAMESQVWPADTQGLDAWECLGLHQVARGLSITDATCESKVLVRKHSHN